MGKEGSNKTLLTSIIIARYKDNSGSHSHFLLWTLQFAEMEVKEIQKQEQLMHVEEKKLDSGCVKEKSSLVIIIHAMEYSERFTVDKVDCRVVMEACYCESSWIGMDQLICGGRW